MPRKATQKSPDVEIAVNRINSYCDLAKVSVFGLSREVGVNQSALSRFLSGERKTVTETARRVLDYIEKRHNRHNGNGILILAEESSEGYKLIESAVRSLWDGNRHTAELLASLIRALKPALDMATAVTHGGSPRRRA